MKVGTIARPVDYAAEVAAHGFEFLDFGCSHGGSIAHAKKLFDAQGDGLGIDISDAKIRQARKAGHQAVKFDILEIPDQRVVRFVTMLHFLEHTQGYSQARAFIGKACRIVTDFVYIAQPYFDADGQLLQHGLKLYWSDWVGHPYTMSTLDLYRIFREILEVGGISNFTIALFQPIHSSDNEAILPVETGVDQLGFDPSVHPQKPSVDFEFPVYREVRAVASRDPAVHREVMERIDEHHVLVEGTAHGVVARPVCW